MMRVWKVVVLVNLALAMGLAGGYLARSPEVRQLQAELAAARQAARERESGERSWTVRGIVRSVLPQLRAVFLTHEAIPGLMPGMTMGFEAEDPRVFAGLAPGDLVRFTLVQKGERLVLVAIAKEPPE